MKKVLHPSLFLASYLFFAAFFYRVGKCDRGAPFPYLSVTLLLSVTLFFLLLCRKGKSRFSPFLSIGGLLLFLPQKELFMIALLAFFEESVFRLFGDRLFTRLGYTPRVTAFATASIFALAHLTRLFAGEAPLLVFLTVLYAFLCGLLFFFLYKKSGSILLPAALHLLSNLLFAAH